VQACFAPWYYHSCIPSIDLHNTNVCEKKTEDVRDLSRYRDLVQDTVFMQLIQCILVPSIKLPVTDYHDCIIVDWTEGYTFAVLNW
jgi:hypothetical protein